MQQTLAEKIISRHAGRPVGAGDIAIVPVDGTMATDATAPFAIRAFEGMGGTRLWDPDRVALVLDHATPAPNERVSNLHDQMRDFARRMGCKLFDVGEGICHQLMMDNGRVKAGDIFVGADSHTPTYGALGAFAVGVGSTDMAAVMLTGKTWLKVPTSLRLELNGELRPGVAAKDVVLHLVGKLGIAGATYDSVEFSGSLVEGLSLSGRVTLANMVAEMGAKAGMIDAATATDDSVATGSDATGTAGSRTSRGEAVRADPGASYRAHHTLDLSGLRPQVATPHSPDKVVDIDEVVGQKVQMAFIGSCTNSRLEDLQAAARVLEGRSLAPGVRLIIAPGSRQIFNAALHDGTVEILSNAGASFITSGCGPCVGTHQGVPGNDETVISSTNRNFRGRMGNPNSNVFLGSPTVVAAAAVAGEIVDPADVLQAGAA